MPSHTHTHTQVHAAAAAGGEDKEKGDYSSPCWCTAQLKHFLNIPCFKTFPASTLYPPPPLLPSPHTSSTLLWKSLGITQPAFFLYAIYSTSWQSIMTDSMIANQNDHLNKGPKSRAMCLWGDFRPLKWGVGHVPPLWEWVSCSFFFFFFFHIWVWPLIVCVGSIKGNESQLT